MYKSTYAVALFNDYSLTRDIICISKLPTLKICLQETGKKYIQTENNNLWNAVLFYMGFQPTALLKHTV